MPDPTTTTGSDPELLDLLRDAGRRWGPLGVALAAASLTDREALTRKLTGVTAADRRLRGQYGRVAGELADATMTMWHLEPGDRSDMPLAERITTLVAELARQRDAAAAERDRIRGEMERCVWIDPRRQSGTPCLGGTRISAHIIARRIADGTTAEQIRDMYPDVTDGHLRAVAAFMADRDTARRDGAADALAYAARRAQRRHSPVGAPCVTSTELRNWAAQARSGELAIPEEVTGHG